MMCWNVSHNFLEVPHPRAEDVARPLPTKGEVFGQRQRCCHQLVGLGMCEGAKPILV